MSSSSSIASPRACTDRDGPTLNGVSVSLREDAPLRACMSGAVAVGVSGPRVIPAAFCALSAAITVALVSQLYSGHYEVTPHASLSSDAALCSRSATDALKEGGGAIDAAARAALCLTVLAPHRTSLDASGALLYWQYRESRTQQPTLFEWGGVEDGGVAGAARPPRLVAALAHLHAQLGTLPWARIIEPTIQLARTGIPVSEELSAAASTAGLVQPVNTNITAPDVALYLSSLLSNTSAELSAAWGGGAVVRQSVGVVRGVGAWRVVVGGAGAGAASRCLRAALDPPPASLEDAELRVVSAIQSEVLSGGGGASVRASVATGLAAVDTSDNYVALVTGLSEPFGSGPIAADAEAERAGWRRDEPSAPLDLAPAFILDEHICGSRYIVGAESWVSLAQAGVALAVSGAPSAVERARLTLAAGGVLAREAERDPPPPPPTPPRPPAPPPYAAVNVVLQRADTLSSHADSRGGGLASRF